MGEDKTISLLKMSLLVSRRELLVLAFGFTGLSLRYEKGDAVFVSVTTVVSWQKSKILLVSIESYDKRELPSDNSRMKT